MFSYEIYEKFENIYFEEQIRTTDSSSSSFKLDLVDLTVFLDLNFRLAKVKPFTSVSISPKFSHFCCHAFSSLCYKVWKWRSFVFSFIFKELTSKVTDDSAVFLWSQQSYEDISRIIWKHFDIILWEYWIISRKIVRSFFFRLFEIAFPPIRLDLFS